MKTIPDGLIAVVKRDCPTCTLIAGVLGQIAVERPLVVATQDDPSFPPDVAAVDDTALEWSFALGVETVPTLLRVEGGRVAERIEGWSRPQWESFVGIQPLGDGLPDHRPGCGSRTLDPAIVRARSAAHADATLRSRRVPLGDLEDDIEACVERGWSDGLPVVPLTPERGARMLDATSRRPDEIVATVPPDLVECTMEKVAINALLAGCEPDYLPVVLACVNAACTDEFNMHDAPSAPGSCPLSRRILALMSHYMQKTREAMASCASCCVTGLKRRAMRRSWGAENLRASSAS